MSKWSSPINRISWENRPNDDAIVPGWVDFDGSGVLAMCVFAKSITERRAEETGEREIIAEQIARLGFGENNWTNYNGDLCRRSIF
jgi:hypothetical protein